MLAHLFAWIATNMSHCSWQGKKITSLFRVGLVLLRMLANLPIYASVFSRTEPVPPFKAAAKLEIGLSASSTVCASTACSRTRKSPPAAPSKLPAVTVRRRLSTAVDHRRLHLCLFFSQQRKALPADPLPDVCCCYR